MNKFKFGTIAVLALVTVLATATMVSAQTATPPTPQDGTGNGFKGGRGSQQGMQQRSGTTSIGSGLLHDEILPIIAEKLGITVDELNTRLAEGETMSQIAYSLGWTYDDFRTLMLDARSQAIEQLVEEGTLTQEQADWISERGAGQMMGGRRGMGQGQYSNPACPYYQTNP
ncbi:MAG: YckD family protein [Chloroflexi bacterium]|nr:YckD family protein [Chloroflexota bacterium]